MCGSPDEKSNINSILRNRVWLLDIFRAYMYSTAGDLQGCQQSSE